MLTLPFCHILTQDELFPEIEKGGLAVVVGESPNATVKLSVADKSAKKYRLLDRLTHASYTRNGDTWTFTGMSDHLRSTIGTTETDATLSFQVTPEPGCEDCRK